MLADGQGRHAAGGSDDAVVAFLRAQEHVVKGPCVHAFLLERASRPAAWTATRRWPRLAEAAAVHAVGAALATPIGLYGGPVGACLLVSVRPQAWTDTEQQPAEDLRLGAGRDAGAGRRGPARRRAVAPTPGPAPGPVVEQAKGALMPPRHRRRPPRSSCGSSPGAPGARWPRSRPASCAASAPVPRRRPRLR